MNKVNYLMQLACHLWMCMVLIHPSLGYSSADLHDSFISEFSTIKLSEADTKAFLDKSQLEISAYLDRVIIIDNNQIYLKRDKQKIMNDLTKMVNYYLAKTCPDYDIIYGGFSPQLEDKLMEIDKSRNGRQAGNREYKNRLDEIKRMIQDELHEFISYYESEENIKPRDIKPPSKLDPLDVGELYLLSEESNPAMDPFTGEPLLEINNLDERIVAMLESNNQLILLLSNQMISLQQEMIELKKEGLEYQREFADIHKRIDGLESVINEIRSQNSLVSLNPNMTPIARETTVKLLFNKNSYTIGDEYYTLLENVSKKLKSHNEYRIVITGMADKSGNKKLNEEISRKRALATSLYLQNLGVDKKQMLINFVGDSQSSVESKSDRRVEIEWLTR